MTKYNPFYQDYYQTSTNYWDQVLVADYARYDMDMTIRALDWGQQKTQKATLEAHRERVRQVYARVFKAAAKSSEWVQGLLYVENAQSIEDLKKVCNSFDIVWKNEGDMITKNEQIQALKEELRKTQDKIEKLEHGRMGKEPANGTIFKIERRFSEAGQRYTYAAVKADGLWYLTGTTGKSVEPHTWESLKAFVGKYSRVWVMTTSKELVD